MGALVDSTYAGKAAYPYVSCALLELNTLSNGSVTVKQNVKGTLVLRHGSLSSGLGAASCSWVTTSDLTLKDRPLTLKNLQISTEICTEDYYNEWEAEQMGDSAWRNTPDLLTQWLIPQLLATGVAELETMIWQGDGATFTFKGYETLLTEGFVAAAAGDTPIDAGTGQEIGSDTIIDALSLVVDAAPKAIKTKPDFYIGCSFTAYEAYKAAIGAFDSVTPLWNANQALTFNGYTVKRCNGMTDDVIIATTTSNAIFGTALLSDTTSVKVKDMEESTLEENIRFKAKFDAGVEYGCLADVVTLNVPIA